MIKFSLGFVCASIMFMIVVRVMAQPLITVTDTITTANQSGLIVITNVSEVTLAGSRRGWLTVWHAQKESADTRMTITTKQHLLPGTYIDMNGQLTPVTVNSPPADSSSKSLE